MEGLEEVILKGKSMDFTDLLMVGPIYVQICWDKLKLHTEYCILLSYTTTYFISFK